MIGLSSPLQTDAVFGGQATATGRLFGLLAAVLVLNTGLMAIFNSTAPMWGLHLTAALKPASWSVSSSGGRLPSNALASASRLQSPRVQDVMVPDSIPLKEPFVVAGR